MYYQHDVPAFAGATFGLDGLGEFLISRFCAFPQAPILFSHPTLCGISSLIDHPMIYCKKKKYVLPDLLNYR